MVILILSSVRRRGGLLLAGLAVGIQLLVLALIAAPTAQASVKPYQSLGVIQLDDAKGTAPLTLPDPKWSFVAGLPVLGAGAAELGTAGGAAGAGAVCATGVGCAVLAGVAVFGLAYATKDQWLPWVRTHFLSGAALPPNAGEIVPSATFAMDTIDPANLPLAQSFHMSMTATGVTGPGAETSDGSYYWAGSFTYSIVTRDVSGALHHFTGYFTNGATSAKSAGTFFDMTIGQTVGGPRSVVGAKANDQRVQYVAVQPASTCTQALAGVVGAKCPGSYDWGYLGIDQPHDTGTGPTASPTFSSSQVCWNPATGTKTTVTLSGQTNQDGVKVPACPAGYVPDHLTVDAKQFVEDAARHLVDVDWTAAGAPQGAPDSYARCYDSTGHLWSWDSPNACGLSVFVDGQKCVRGLAKCDRWTEIERTDSTRTECHWGPYVVPIERCFVLERAYQWLTVPVTPPNVDGDPDTHDDPTPGVDPSPTPSPTPTGSANPSPTPTGSTNPSASPTPPVTPEPQPPRETPDEAECFPSGWGVFNPVSWVLQPTKCALRWAFIPSPDVISGAGDDVGDDFNHFGITPMINDVGAAVDHLNGSGGCQGPAMHFDLDGVGVHKTLYPFSACDPPMRQAAAFSSALVVLVAGIGGGLAVVRSLAFGFGYQIRVGEWFKGFGR